jgi:DNA polymerase III subunit epsilon
MMSQIAVVDVETTGFNAYRNDRVIELAVLAIDMNGTVHREFTTLVNPERDIGPTRVHGLRAKDVVAAPRFADIAGTLVEIIEGCVALAAHNVRFDHSFLDAEFKRLGYIVPECPTLCTMRLAGGGNLSQCCTDYGISFDGEVHEALHDARAAAQLLTVLLKDAPRLGEEYKALPPISWPGPPKTFAIPLTREQVRRNQVETPSYLKRILERAQTAFPPETDDAAILAYTALLDRALEDRHLDETEGEALADLAMRWGLTREMIESAHWNYLMRLAAAALADGVVTETERRDLDQVASLIGMDSGRLNRALEVAALKMKEMSVSPGLESDLLAIEHLQGKVVCFTGECQCREEGMPITRERAEELAIRSGLFVKDYVTKKLDFLVVADPYTQSGKAKKARQYGIRIVHEPEFWSALNIHVE